MIKITDADIATIATCALSKKPQRYIIVAKSAPPKKFIDQLRAELSKLEKSYRVIHIAYGAYMFVMDNMSTVEIIDKAIYDNHHYSHLVTKDNCDQLALRIHPYMPLM